MHLALSNRIWTHNKHVKSLVRVVTDTEGIFILILTDCLAAVPASDASMCAPSFARALPDALRARDGAPLNLSCAVRGDPDPRVEWLKNGQPLHSSDVSASHLVFLLYLVFVAIQKR